MFYNRNDHTCFRSQDFTLWIVASTMLYLIVLYWSFHFPNNFSNLDLRLKKRRKIYHHWIYMMPQYQLVCAENYNINSLYLLLYFLWIFFNLMMGFIYFLQCLQPLLQYNTTLKRICCSWPLGCLDGILIGWWNDKAGGWNSALLATAVTDPPADSITVI